jgi:hypothetical protein
MKRSRFLLPMIPWAVISWAVISWTVQVHAASVGLQSDQASKASSQAATGEASATGDENGRAQSEKDQASNNSGRSNLDRNETNPAAGRKSVVKPRRAARPAKPASSHQPRSAKTAANESFPAGSAPSANSEFHLTGPSTSTSNLHKTVVARSTPVSLPAVSVNGQQFKNARNPGARMASSGGPANSTRGTAAINGSDMKRKP